MKTCRTCVYARPLQQAGENVTQQAYCHSEPPRIIPMPMPVAKQGGRATRLAIPDDSGAEMQILPTSHRPITLLDNQACRMHEAATEESEQVWRVPVAKGTTN